jgi:nitrite reductase/ring-hydroxylating ferredoxin subunit/Fe-S cluster biogenesis protein NfuA
MSEELTDRAQRVDRARAGLEGLDATSRARAEELQQAIEAFHKEGLTRIIRALKDDPRGLELLMALVEDPEVYALFALHGLVRADPATELLPRVAQAIDAARPYLQSHGGDVELVELRGRTVVVRLTGACHGCSMSASTLRNSVEEAIKAAVPEIEAVEPLAGEPTPVLIPLDALRGKGKGWVAGPPAAEVVEGKPFRLELEGGKSVVLLRFGDQIQAFDNVCAHQGLPLDGGMVDCAEGTITCPWHGFRFDGRTGECLTAPQAQLEPFPLRIEDGLISVRPR